MHDSLSHPLYHYTSLEAFHSIVLSKEIWCSNVFYLNDRSELKYALDQCHRLAVLSRRRFEGKMLELWDEVIDVLVELRLEMHPYEVYAASFSEVEDDLGQWRAYGGAGTGLCVGFSHIALANQMQRQAFDFCKCSYEVARQTEDWETVLHSVVQACEGALAKTDGDVGASRLIVQAAKQDVFLRLGLQIKHPAFQAEREWRFAKIYSSGEPKARFRMSKGSMIPYVSLRLADTNEPVPITQVTVSPGADSLLNIKAIEKFLRANGVTARVSPSGVPYRGQ